MGISGWVPEFEGCGYIVEASGVGNLKLRSAAVEVNIHDAGKGEKVTVSGDNFPGEEEDFILVPAPVLREAFKDAAVGVTEKGKKKAADHGFLSGRKKAPKGLVLLRPEGQK